MLSCNRSLFTLEARKQSRHAPRLFHRTFTASAIHQTPRNPLHQPTSRKSWSSTVEERAKAEYQQQLRAGEQEIERVSREIQAGKQARFKDIRALRRYEHELQTQWLELEYHAGWGRLMFQENPWADGKTPSREEKRGTWRVVALESGGIVVGDIKVFFHTVFAGPCRISFETRIYYLLRFVWRLPVLCLMVPAAAVARMMEKSAESRWKR